MVTKLKQNKVFIIATLLLTIGTTIFLVEYGKRTTYEQNGNYLLNTGIDYIDAVYKKDFLEKFPKNKLTSDDITDEEVEIYRTYFGTMGDQIESIVNQYSDSINSAEESDNQEEVDSLKKVRQEKIDTVISNYTDSSKTKEKICEKTNQYLEKLKQSSQKNNDDVSYFNSNFLYYFKDSNGTVYTNYENSKKLESEQEILAEMADQSYDAYYMHHDSFLASIDMDDAASPWLPTLSTSLNGDIYIKTDSQVESEIMMGEEVIAETTPHIVISLFVFFLGLIVGIFYFRQAVSKNNLITFFHNVPIDVRALVLFFFSVIIILMGLFISGMYWYGLSTVFFFLIVFFFYACLLFYVKDFILTIKCVEGYSSFGKQWENSNFKKISKKCSKLIGNFSLLAQFIISFICALIVLYFWINCFVRGNPFIVVWTMLLLIFFIIIIKQIKKIQNIIVRLDKLSNLNSEDQKITYNLDDISSSLYELEDYIRTSKSEHKQNEQLKAELLTNVSHDLRTPLTSIISYGDILTQKDLSEESKVEYITIINQKSARMKRLIDDLFDVTKMDNGDIQLTKTTLDLTQLIVQATSEYQDSFDKNGLKLVFTFPEEPVMIQVDGDKIWRVIDNLIGNIVKYAMPNTRVFIKLMEAEDFATIQLKNTSRYELNEDAELLTERFKRGDSSRHEEGSGLGLAIAQSIVNLHNGTLSIEVDGDLYKITVRLPKNENEDKLNIQN